MLCTAGVSRDYKLTYLWVNLQLMSSNERADTECLGGKARAREREGDGNCLSSKRKCAKLTNNWKKH